MTRQRLPKAIYATGFLALAAPAYAQQPVSYSRDIQPIFLRRCQGCHSANPKGGFRVDSYQSVMAGGQRGPAVAPGNPNASRLLGMIEGRIQPKMPPGGQSLSVVEVALVRNWITQGAKQEAPAPLANPNPFAAPGQGLRQAPALPPSQAVSLLEPKDGATVRERVKIRVPKASVPETGFAGFFIDGKFRAALAAPDEEPGEKPSPEKANLEYVWDTKAPVTENATAALSDQYVQDGIHIIEVKSYDESGKVLSSAKAQITLQNHAAAASNQPVKLMYQGRVGQQFTVQQVVELKASAAQAARAFSSAAAESGATHKETTKYLLSVEDVQPTTGVTFWRERRESPIVVLVNNLKQVVRFDSRSRYYSITRTGSALRGKDMEREKREPIVNPLDLPGRPQRMNETFLTNLRINLGAYIPAYLDVPRLQAIIEGLEWQNGEQCVRIRCAYNAGTAVLDVNTLGIQKGDFQITNGVSTLWFSERLGRFIKAKHELTGTLLANAAIAGAEAPGAPGGGEFAPGAPGGGGYPGAGAGGYPGARGGGYPGAGGGGGGYPGAGGGGGGYPGRGGGGGGYPGAGGGGGGYPGRGGGGYPGGGAGGYPGGGAGSFGGGGGYPGAGGAGGGTGLPASTKQRYHITLRVTTTEVDDANKGKKTVASN